MEGSKELEVVSLVRKKHLRILLIKTMHGAEDILGLALTRRRSDGMIVVKESCCAKTWDGDEVEDLSLNDLDYFSDISTTPGLVKLIDK